MNVLDWRNGETFELSKGKNLRKKINFQQVFPEFIVASASVDLTKTNSGNFLLKSGSTFVYHWLYVKPRPPSYLLHSTNVCCSVALFQ
jgi:hypothetical protein